jgi:hypothetical protein
VSVLVVEPDETNGAAVVDRLLREGDVVGVIVGDDAARDKWRSLGAHVAVGPADDADLIERAGQHARSIVLFDALPNVLNAAIEGARMASSSPARIVFCSTAASDVEGMLLTSGLEYVILSIPIERTGLRRRPRQTIEPEAVAEAVNAADDLGDEIKLSLDLADEDALGTLKLDQRQKQE